MSSIIIIVLVFAAICYYQIPPLVEGQYWKELAAISVFMLLAFVLTLMRVIGTELPNPNEGVATVLKYFIKDLEF